MGYTHRFERLMSECGQGHWPGDPVEIRARVSRKHKADERDEAHLLELSLTKRLPLVWVSSAERDGRQLLQYR
jgi:hypothetical protein